jgi:hypothetical protein
LCLTLLSAVPLLFGGCGGVSASKTISPLDFLLPGILRNDPPQTNAPVVLTVSGMEPAFQPSGLGNFPVAPSINMENPMNPQAGMPALPCLVIAPLSDFGAAVEIASAR